MNKKVEPMRKKRKFLTLLAAILGLILISLTWKLEDAISGTILSVREADAEIELKVKIAVLEIDRLRLNGEYVIRVTTHFEEDTYPVILRAVSAEVEYDHTEPYYTAKLRVGTRDSLLLTSTIKGREVWIILGETTIAEKLLFRRLVSQFSKAFRDGPGETTDDPGPMFELELN